MGIAHMSYSRSFLLVKMKVDPNTKPDPTVELPDAWWYRVYVGVIIATILVITALWAFSRHFSS